MYAQAQQMVQAWQQTMHETWERQSTALPASGGAAGAAPPDGFPPPPPKGSTPEQYAAYLRTLNEEQLRAVANRDGLAAELRDQANRTLLPRDQERLRNEIAALRAKAKDAVGPGGEAERLTSNYRADELQTQLDRLNVVADNIQQRRPGDDNGYFLLGYDPAADEGRAIVAKSNPDTAKNVATLIPGATTALDGNFAGTINRINEVQEAALRADPNAPTSVIAWLDYDAPEFNEVPFDANANNASKDLDSFQDGLRASHVGDKSHNTVVGHSYGAFVAGVADRDTGLDIDELVSAGGTGLGVNHATDLNIAPEHVWATEATAENVDGEDTTADLGRGYGFLRNNAADESFGARVFESDAPVPLRQDTHGQYFEDTGDTHLNPGLNNIGAIIAGKPTEPR